MVLREGVSSLDAAKVWNFDSLKRSHFVIASGFRVECVIYLQYVLEGKEVNMLPTGVSRVSPSIFSYFVKRSLYGACKSREVCKTLGSVFVLN